MNFADALARIKKHAVDGRFDDAWSALRHAMLGSFKIPDLQKLNRELQAHAAAWNILTGGKVIRFALVGGYTTDPIKQLLLPLALAEGYWAEIYEGTYNTFESEPLDPSSGLYQFRPDIVLFATGTVNLTSFPPAGAESVVIGHMADEVLAACRARWHAIAVATSARIIQHNFELPSVLPLGRLEGRLDWSATNFVRLLNDRLWEHDGHEIRVLDTYQIAANCGRRQWHDSRWYHHSKHGFDPSLIYHYGRALAGLLRGMLGTTRKCLVTDLDNTLWGGVIGDDGLDGIQLGNVSASGEAYAEFGRYLKSLQRLGTVLAVNSKNHAQTAAEVFNRHPETVLRQDDFGAFICNWERKSDNIRAIAHQLNLGLDSLVFVDDNPAECEEVRAVLPEVTVIEMSGDPAGFPRRIEELQLFTPLDFTTEDLARAQSYAAAQQITRTGDSSVDLDAHLSGLAMEASIGPAHEGDLPRLEQLFSKTNQFNLTGRKYEKVSLQQMMNSPDKLLLAGRLKDKFSNHGLVSALAARCEGSVLIVENWVMSCRVFTRTLEESILNRLIDEARLRGCTSVLCTIVPTSKNEYAQRFFAKLGWHTGQDDAAQVCELRTTMPEYKTFVQTV
ncbi:MAG: HAD-IIIC family phosphatase [Prosthecobacter sp.]|uniref:HAD-IIIC family phosphatase n=1 Tax=Prosthecobacter sp. TaxID=1965333 RepID=UPI003902AFDD